MFWLNSTQITIPDQLEDSRLIDFLRDHLKLTGTKYGCGQGLCGACTVHLDNEAVRACQYFLRDLTGRHITTIEGLASTEESSGLHPVQQAWIAEAVPQCGYCQPGQIMSAAALLGKNPAPDDDEISAAMDGNLCRCGTYGRIRKAIKHAAGEMKNAD